MTRTPCGTIARLGWVAAMANMAMCFKRNDDPWKNISLTKMPTTLYEEQHVKKSIGNCQDMQTMLFVSVIVWRANCMKSYRKLTRYANLVVRFSHGMESKLYANP